MKSAVFTLVLFMFAAVAIAEEPVIHGRVTGILLADAEVCVHAIRLGDKESTRIRSVSREEFFSESQKDSGVRADSDGRFEIKATEGVYALFAFSDRNGNGVWDPSGPEAIGWYADEAAGYFARVRVEEGMHVDVEFALSAPTHFGTETKTVAGGKLRSAKGYTVLELSGDAKTRGYAHGNLVAQQIVDFFRFYILEEKFRSAKNYENGFAKFLHSHFDYPEPFVVECGAVIEGMKDSGVDLYIPELERNFSLTDLYAINGYIETRAMRSSCTQFAAWGERTNSTDVDGGMITGRNMDGEIDLRRVTVSHFMLFAVDPSEDGQKRFVSMMWPGFVATISGFNEDGFYTMENAGLTGPGGVVNKLVPFSWAMRESLARLGADATAEDVQQLVDSFDNAAGGSCGPGCVTLFAVPFHGQDQPAFVMEGDRFGDRMRFAQDAAPNVPQALVASNHHRIYGVDELEPNQVFGKEVGFSSRWRYEAGMHKLAAWYRVGQSIGTKQMQELLQTVAHGTTEYAVITRPNQREFDVAVASMKAEMWDAPYREWTTFHFDELFTQPSVTASE